MAATISATKLTTFAICYGFLEGPLHSRRLRRQLTKTGLRSAPATSADILIAHSAGCWLIPPSARPKLIVYIGMPLVMARPPATWLHANLSGLRRGHILSNLRTRFQNTCSGLLQPKRNLNILRHPNIGHPVVSKGAAAIFIANRDDPWPRGPELDKLLSSTGWSFVSLPGGHDDLWEQPELYADIITHYA